MAVESTLVRKHPRGCRTNEARRKSRVEKSWGRPPRESKHMMRGRKQDKRSVFLVLLQRKMIYYAKT